MREKKNVLRSGIVTLRISPEKLSQIDAEAEKQGRPRANLIKWIIDQYFKNQGKI